MFALSFTAVLVVTDDDPTHLLASSVDALRAVTIRTTAPGNAPVAAIDDQPLYLVRATLMALEHANRTGNYTVLRALATPQFQARNSSEDLARTFLDLRRRGIDLAPAAITLPHLAAPAVIERDGRLRLVGFYRLGDRQIRFDLVFLPVDGHWRFDALGLGVVPIEHAALEHKRGT